MNTLFTDITDSEATSVVGGKFASFREGGNFKTTATAKASSSARTRFDDAYQQTFTVTSSDLTDTTASSKSSSGASILYLS